MYNDVLLLEPINEPYIVGRHSWFSVGPGLSLHLIANEGETMEHLRSNHMCASVGSMDDFIEHPNDMDVPYYNSKGKPQVKQIRPDGIQQIYIIDPEGHWIEINDEVGRE